MMCKKEFPIPVCSAEGKLTGMIVVYVNRAEE